MKDVWWYPIQDIYHSIWSDDWYETTLRWWGRSVVMPWPHRYPSVLPPRGVCLRVKKKVCHPRLMKDVWWSPIQDTYSSMRSNDWYETTLRRWKRSVVMPWPHRRPEVLPPWGVCLRERHSIQGSWRMCDDTQSKILIILCGLMIDMKQLSSDGDTQLLWHGLAGTQQCYHLRE
jgi:hypothetical protein